MAGFILVLLAILGGAVFAAAAFRRRVAEMVPLSVVSMIAFVYGFGLVGLLRAGAIITVIGFILMGAAGLCASLRKGNKYRPAWDISLVFFVLSLVWLVYSSAGRIPLVQEDFTQWALAPKAMFYTGSLTPADGTLSFSPAMSVFQYIFQVFNALFAPGEGFAEWLLYVSCGTACLALLLPFVKSTHPRKLVRAGYSLLFFLALLCVPLHAFRLFSALNPDGFLAILAAASFLTAVQKKSSAQAVITGLYLFTLTLAKDTGLFFALSTLAVYFVTLLRSEEYSRAERKMRIVLVAIPVLFILLARVSWPHLSFSLHEAGSVGEVLQLFTANFSAKLITYRVGLSLGGSSQFMLVTAHVSFLALTILLAGFTALLSRSMKARDSLRDLHTALLYAPIVTVVFVAGLWLSYLLVIDKADASKLVNFQRLISIGYVFWMLLIAASALRLLAERPAWTWRQHILVVLACVCMALLCSGTLSELISRNFTAANEKYHTYYAIAEEAKRNIPEDASVYIVSQNDDGTYYHTIRYALYPRRTNPGNTWWLRDPDQKQNDWTYPVTADQWKAELAPYDYVLVYQADSYLQTAVAAAVTADAAIASNQIYRIDKDTGLLEAMVMAE